MRRVPFQFVRSPPALRHISLSPALARRLPGNWRHPIKVNTTALRVGNVLRFALAVAVGIGLGLSWSLAGDRAADVASAPSAGQRAGTSSTVSAATWTDGPWPFTIAEGELRCVGPEDDPGVFIAFGNGDRYALNPAAIDMADQVGALVDLDPIWRDHPDIPGAKLNVSPVILHALKLC